MVICSYIIGSLRVFPLNYLFFLHTVKFTAQVGICSTEIALEIRLWAEETYLTISAVCESLSLFSLLQMIQTVFLSGSFVISCRDSSVAAA